MRSVLPPVLDRKLRGHRFAWWSCALAETVCLGALLVAILNPLAVLLAPLWLLWKLARYPDNRAVAAAIEARHRHLQDNLSAAVELAESADPPSVKGSPELLQLLYADVDRQIAAIDFTRLVSLKLVTALVITCIIVNATLANKRRQYAPQHPAPAAVKPVPPAPPQPMTLLARLKSLAATLARSPDQTLRSLPPRARSLDPAVNAAERAQAAADPGDAQALSQTAAETLSEFARLAAAVPELAALAREAADLAQQFANLSLPATTLTATGVSPRPDITATGTGEARTPLGTLPAVAPGGPPWTVAATKLDNVDSSRSPPQYEPQIRVYLERLASFPH